MPHGQHPGMLHVAPSIQNYVKAYVMAPTPPHTHT